MRYIKTVKCGKLNRCLADPLENACASARTRWPTAPAARNRKPCSVCAFCFRYWFCAGNVRLSKPATILA